MSLISGHLEYMISAAFFLFMRSLFLFILTYFIVVQLQLSAFSAYPSIPPNLGSLLITVLVKEMKLSKILKEL